MTWRMVGLAACLWVSLARADVVVIVHPDSPVTELSTSQVADYFLGRTRTLRNGDEVLLLEQPRDSTLREEFFRRLNGMSLRQLNAYWARLQFSGQIQPPQSLPDSRAVLDAVRRNRNALGYADAAVVDNSVRVVLRLKD